MPRRATNRLVLPGLACCYHITQRCQERRYLLRQAKDRRQYLNMVRAGVVRHPSEWYGGAFSEHSGARQRYRIIDQPRLLNCLECADGAAFADWYGRSLNEACERAPRVSPIP